MNLNLNMNLGIDLTAANHMKELFNMNWKGESDLDKISFISASLLILTNLANHINARADFLDYISTVVNKLVKFSLTTNADIVKCLTLAVIKNFIVDLGSFNDVERRESNIKNLLGFVFKSLNNPNQKHSVLYFLFILPRSSYSLLTLLAISLMYTQKVVQGTSILLLKISLLIFSKIC